MYDAQFSLPTAPPPTLGRAMDESRPQWLPPATPQTAHPAPPASPTPPADTSTPPPWQDDSRPLYKRIGGAIVAGLLVIVKFGKAALLLLPKLKILTTSGSMLVSVAAYSLI